MKNVLKGLLYAVCLYICLVFQTSLAGYFRVGGVTPDLVLIFTLWLAFETEKAGIVTAAINGFCMDMLSAANFNGLYMLMYTALAFGMNIFRKAAQGVWKYVWFLAGIAVASLISELFVSIFTADGLAQLADMIMRQVLPRTVYNVLLILPYVLIRTVILKVQYNRRRKTNTIY